MDVECGDFAVAELEIDGRDSAVEMMWFRRADDGRRHFGEQPCE